MKFESIQDVLYQARVNMKPVLQLMLPEEMVGALQKTASEKQKRPFG